MIFLKTIKEGNRKATLSENKRPHNVDQESL